MERMLQARDDRAVIQFLAFFCSKKVEPRGTSDVRCQMQNIDVL